MCGANRYARALIRTDFLAGILDPVNAKRAPGTPSASVADAAPNSLTLALARNLVAARDSINMSQRELAARCGLARTYLRRVETGEANVGLGVLLILSRVVGKQPHDLIKPFDDLVMPSRDLIKLPDASIITSDDGTMPSRDLIEPARDLTEPSREA